MGFRQGEMKPLNLKVLIKGAGEMASGVAFSLYRAHLSICLTELPDPMAVRRSVCFSEVVYEKEKTVEGVGAILVDGFSDIIGFWTKGVIPVIVDPECSLREKLRPDVLVDAVMAKKNTGTKRDDAPLVIALGPGFEAGKDCHFVIETNRGHHLGRVIEAGSAEADTRIPGEIAGYTLERILRAPADGTFRTKKKIGERVRKGAIIGKVNGTPVKALIDGTIRGLLRDGARVTAPVKIGDIDPRYDQSSVETISDKARAIGGGVLEAIMRHYNK